MQLTRPAASSGASPAGSESALPCEPPPTSDAAKDTVARLRTALHAVPDADALVGGYTAQQYDTPRTAERDRTLIVPVILGIILLILVVLLRSLPMPAPLVATMALN